MTLATGLAVNTFPVTFGPDGAGDDRFYRLASGECTVDGGAWQPQGYDENGQSRSLNGRLTCVHRVLWTDHTQRTSTFLLGFRQWFHDSCAQRTWQGNVDTFRTFGDLVWKTRAHPCQLPLEQRSEVHSVQHCEQHPEARKQIWQSSALVSLTVERNIGPIEVTREDVEMRCVDFGSRSSKARLNP